MPEAYLTQYQQLEGLSNAQIKPTTLRFHSAGGKGIFSWLAATNNSYTIEYTSSLSEPDWKTYASGYSGADELIVTNDLSLQSSFFRLVW